MAELVFIALCIAGAFVLAMWRAPMWAWAVALAGAVLAWQTGLLHGEFEEPEFGLLGLLAWAPVVILAGLSIPALRRAALIEPTFRIIKGILPKVSATEQEALERRHHRLRRRAVLRPARLGRSCGRCRPSR